MEAQKHIRWNVVEELKGQQPVYWYRYEQRTYAPTLDEWGNRDGPSRHEIVLMKLTVSKETKCGVWLCIGRFCKRDARKRYACPTIEEARESFIARKKRQIAILTGQLRQAQRALEVVSRNNIDNRISVSCITDFDNLVDSS